MGESKILSTFGNMLPSGFYSWDTQVLIPQSPVHLSSKNMPPTAGVNGEVADLATAPDDGTSETTCTALWVKKFDVADYRHEDLLLKIDQIDDLEIPLPDMSDPHLFSLAQSFPLYRFNHARVKLSVATTATTTCSEGRECALSATTPVFDESPRVILLHGRHRLQPLREHQQTRNLACIKASLLVQCATEQNSGPIAKTKALKLINHSNKVSSIVRLGSPFIVVVKSIMNISAAFEKE